MKTKIRFIFILVFLLIALILTMKYVQYSRLKSSEMLESFYSLENVISQYFYKYWEVPDREDIIGFIRKRQNSDENKKVLSCFDHYELSIVADSINNSIQTILFSDGKYALNENAILIGEMTFGDFLVKKEILVSQQSIDDLCSYFKFKFFINSEPVENDFLKGRIHALLIKKFHTERQIDMGSAQRCMFKCTVVNPDNVNLSLVCGKVDSDFPFDELQNSIKDMLLRSDMLGTVDKFYFPLYY